MKAGKCILYFRGGQPCLVSYAGVDCEHESMNSGNGANLQPLTQDPCYHTYIVPALPML